MAEHVEDAGNVIERWRETFGMEMAEGGGWTWAPFWKEWDRSINEHDKLVRDYNALVRLWNSYFAVINGASEKQRKPVGRPLAAEEGETRCHYHFSKTTGLPPRCPETCVGSRVGRACQSRPDWQASARLPARLHRRRDHCLR
jgi:hypothetical protein